MQTLDRDELSIHIEAPLEDVYEIVADVTRTPEYSPEVASCVWLGGAAGPALGARFKAQNRIGKSRWSNKPIITAVLQGREFAFARTEPLCGTVHWRYRFEPEHGGTRVTESYEVVRPITRAGWIIVSGFGRDRNRRKTLHDGIEESLHRLRTIAEQAQTGAPTL
ncbi:SRPBCC family protein [Arthrobacter sp. SX1312]|uniref:SRPBCC family protein n=1 Tax=Arthrobacter sp. SX1312 TaxID=2058896 RepID=UPI000CE4F7BC|nr:SRPBCC family protein [Arthrobacter sp. SX1312]